MWYVFYPTPSLRWLHHHVTIRQNMKNSIKYFSLNTLLGLALAAPSLTFAQETANQNNDGGFLKVGYGYKHETSPYQSAVKGGSLFVNGRYQWNGLFVEAFYGANERNEGLSIGYNFYNTEHWNFDINTVQAHDDINWVIGDGDKVIVQDYENTDMLGLRATGFYDQTTLQFLVAPYSFNSSYDDGIYASAWLGQSWQLKNWEFHASLGLEYRSEEIMDYYYAISNEQATEHLTAYDPSAGIDATAQFSLSYPISQHVVFESYLKYTDYSSGVDDSPIMGLLSNINGRDDNKTEFGLLVSYVF